MLLSTYEWDEGNFHCSWGSTPTVAPEDLSSGETTKTWGRNARNTIIQRAPETHEAEKTEDESNDKDKKWATAQTGTA